jgi:hypothetical protein
MAEEKTCFVIAPIGEPGGPIRKRSDQVMKYIIKPVLEPLGYGVVRADDISEPGIITNQVIQRVVDASLVIADLTGHNPNVFYELAIRHAIKKPLVQLISVRDTIPFDVAGMRTIKVNINDLDTVEEAKAELKSQVRSIEAGTLEPESPITVALNLQALEGSDNPQADALVSIQQAIAELRLDVQALASARQLTWVERQAINQGLAALPGYSPVDLDRGVLWQPQYLKGIDLAAPEAENKAADSEITPDASDKGD